MNARAACFILIASLVVVGCGKKGPPLDPLHLVPNIVEKVVARRVGETVRIQFAVPATNLNGPGPAQVDRVEIYAITLGPGAAAPSNRDLMTATYKVGTMSVKPVPVEGEPVLQTAVADARPAPGDAVEFTEALTPEILTPVTLPEPRAPATPPPADAAPVPAVPTYAQRIYVIRGMTKGGRGGQPSARMHVPLVSPPAPPSGLTTSFTETTLRLAWTGPPAAAEATTPEFNVYDSGGAVPLNPAPLAQPVFEQPVSEFGKQRCVVVRSVTTVAAIPIESEPSAISCVTPTDIFPPAAPQRLQVVPSPGAMNLSWQPNAEADAAGYLVLRGDVPGETLTALTPEPITTPRFEDKTVRAGARYVYVVVAVDRATPRNTSAHSNRVEETAR